MWVGEGEGVPHHPEILLSGYYRFLFRPLYDLFHCKRVKKLGKVTILQQKKSPSRPLTPTNSQKIGQVTALGKSF
jgi:hypothetical protein